MILTNTVSTTTTLNNASSTVSAPADISAPVGYMPASNGESWVALPGPAVAIKALGTVTTAANLDCTLAGYFTLTGTAGSAIAMTFGTGSATGTFSCYLGQVIKIRVTASGATVNTMTWTGYTVSWIGMLTGTSGSSQAALFSWPASWPKSLWFAPGVGAAPTFDGTYMIGT